MDISFQLIRKVEPKNKYTLFHDGYVFLEIKENELNTYSGGFKNPRNIVLNPREIAKILLLQPRCYVDDLLEKIKITNKGKLLIIDQTNENTYTFNLTVINPHNQDKFISSSVELFAEDIVILHIYLEVCIVKSACIERFMYFRLN
jgi:hypothetical protein